MPNFEALDRHVLNRPDEGGRDFYAKLEDQLNTTGPRVKQLAAEMLWVMFLTPLNIDILKKREGIQRIWGLSGVYNLTALFSVRFKDWVSGWRFKLAWGVPVVSVQSHGQVPGPFIRAGPDAHAGVPVA